MSSIFYNLNLDKNFDHIYKINLKLENPNTDQKFFLPTWAPGSYMIREFSQHIINIKAFSGKKEINIEKINKNTFIVLGNYKEIELEYEIYAFDGSIRASYLDSEFGFFNGSSLFLCAEGFYDKKCYLKIENKHLEVTTSMPKDGDLFFENTFQDFIDHPVWLGVAKKLSFNVYDIPHEISLVQDVRNFDEERFLKDIKILCQAILDFFNKKAPFEKYLFISRFEEGGYGGLEHKNSSFLLSSPYSLPKKGLLKEPDTNYKSYLSLIAHEYFHAWNVKSLRPKNFVKYDLNKECHTTMLWAFEGITSYYDDLFVKRAGLISKESYLDTIKKNILGYLNTLGRKTQNLSEASFDAWIKFYRPHENSANFQISYYLQGGLFAYCLDKYIRENSKSEKSLDDVMRYLYENFKEDRGITEKEWILGAEKATNLNLENFIKKYVYSTEELPLDYKLVLEDDLLGKIRAKMGFKWVFDQRGRAIVSFVSLNSPASLAGLAPNDEILAINNIRLDEKNQSDFLSRIIDENSWNIIYSRKKNIKTALLIV